MWTLPKEDTTTRMSTIMGKIMGDAYGDNRFDFYDFIPLLVVLVGSAVLVAGLFPSGFRKVGCHEFRRISELSILVREIAANV